MQHLPKSVPVPLLETQIEPFARLFSCTTDFDGTQAMSALSAYNANNGYKVRHKGDPYPSFPRYLVRKDPPAKPSKAMADGFAIGRKERERLELPEPLSFRRLKIILRHNRIMTVTTSMGPKVRATGWCHERSGDLIAVSTDLDDHAIRFAFAELYGHLVMESDPDNKHRTLFHLRYADAPRMGERTTYANRMAAVECAVDPRSPRAYRARGFACGFLNEPIENAMRIPRRTASG